VFVLTHNYTGYPMIRQARAMVAEGLLGTIRVVQAEYVQDWLTTSWRTRARSRPRGASTRRAPARPAAPATSRPTR
jgi:predicted dehydrogenase